MHKLCTIMQIVSSPCRPLDNRVWLFLKNMNIYFSKDINIYRRIFWFFIFVLGLSYSVNMICHNAHRYYGFPSMIKPSKPVHAEFPKVGFNNSKKSSTPKPYNGIQVPLNKFSAFSHFLLEIITLYKRNYKKSLLVFRDIKIYFHRDLFRQVNKKRQDQN